MATNFTDRMIKAIRPPETGVDKYWDLAVSSFGLFVYSSGKKTWKLMYRVKGQLKNKKLGVYPALSLADARKDAEEILQNATKGIDLVEERKKPDENIPFKVIAQDYLEMHAKPKKRQWKTDERLIDNELLPKWKRLKGSEITRRNVISLLDGLVKRGAPIQANRVHSLINMIFNWAISRDLLDYNPCQQVKKPSKENQRERVLSEKEIEKIWKAFEEQGAYISAIFKLMLLTAQRRWEISHMKIADVDRKTGWWVIPGEIAKNGLSHRVPLTELALEIIIGLPKPKKGQIWMFPSPTRKGQHIDNVQKAAKRVQEKSKVEDFVLHDLRRTAASYMAASGVPGTVIGKVLNHVEPGVTKVYNRYSYDSEKKEALQKWEENLKEVVGLTGEKQSKKKEESAPAK